MYLSILSYQPYAAGTDVVLFISFFFWIVGQRINPSSAATAQQGQQLEEQHASSGVQREGSLGPRQACCLWL